MTKKIEIPLERKIIKFLPIKLPEKCVYCGGLKEETHSHTIKRSYTVGKRQVKHDMGPFEIPYCRQHHQAIEKVDAKTGKFTLYVFIPLALLLAVLQLIFWYKPIYHWGLDVAQENLGNVLGGISSGFFSVFIILLMAVIAAGLLAWLAASILRGIMKPPEGLKISAPTGNLLLDFANDDIAGEFLSLNEDLGARIWSFKQTFNEGMQQDRKQSGR
jgi:hypothetical protein